VDDSEAQEVLERIEDTMEIPSYIVDRMDSDEFAEFIESWADLMEARFDERPHTSEKFIDRLGDQR
jgi:hypothetical protein